ncbi:MAG: metallophosphoesterase [Peptococcaceae bacterium BRH_c4b]|nr:MAG: metallophosphoesterase [Peptococcaceae bacterium BRH_c4b]
MRLLMIGDIVGRPGRQAVKDNITGLISEFKVDITVANGENSAGGNGLTREVGRELLAMGIDVITMGNHVWNHKEIFNYISQEKRIVRPANYPPGAPGLGVNVFIAGNGTSVAVMNLSGRVFMPELDCPFRKVDEMLASLDKQVRVVLLDFHAEASSEKVAMGWYLDGRVSAVCGTHTHVQTADERILPGGTAYITDVGMTGPRDSVIGVKKELVIEKFITQLPRRFEVANSSYQLNAVLVDIDDTTGRATDIRRIQNYE